MKNLKKSKPNFGLNDKPKNLIILASAIILLLILSFLFINKEEPFLQVLTDKYKQATELEEGLGVCNTKEDLFALISNINNTKTVMDLVKTQLFFKEGRCRHLQSPTPFTSLDIINTKFMLENGICEVLIKEKRRGESKVFTLCSNLVREIEGKKNMTIEE